VQTSKRSKRAAITVAMAGVVMALLVGCSITPSLSVSHRSHSGEQQITVAKTAKQTVKRAPTPVYTMELVPSHASVTAGNVVNLQKNVYYTNRVVVVSFHDMSLHFHSKFNMSPTVFAADLQALHQYHFHVITNEQFTGWLDHRNVIPPNAVLLTFDDGYRSMYTHAFPILMKYHMPGTFFIITHSQDIAFHGFMTWPEAQAMAKAGMSIESHTYDLHYLVNVNGKLVPAFDTAYYEGKWQTPKQYFLRDYHDFLTARLQIQQHLGRPINQIAWPYGYGNLTAYEAAKAAGYRYFYTTAAGVNLPWTSSWYIRRIDVGLYSNTAQVINKILGTAGSRAQLVPAKPSLSDAHRT
jgi:poly-beta-1,6-N-acetyl-D-glucosamine N-deacetylase